MSAKTTSQRIAALALAAAFAANGALAQPSQSKSGKPLANAKMDMMSGKMGEQCREMMAMHAQMMADMKEVPRSVSAPWCTHPEIQPGTSCPLFIKGTVGTYEGTVQLGHSSSAI